MQQQKSNQRKTASGRKITSDVARPDVPSGKWESSLYSGIPKETRMKIIQKLADGIYSYPDAWRAVERRKNYGNAIEWILLVMGVETWAEVVHHFHIHDSV